jgi:MFS family permease
VYNGLLSETPIKPLTARSWLTLFTTFVVLTVAFSFGIFALPPFYPFLVKTFGWNQASVTSGNAINLLLVGILSPFIGIAVDRFSAKAVILGGTCLVALALALLSTMTSFPQYLAYCFVLGLGTCAVSIVPNSMLIGPYFSGRRGLAVGFINAGIGLGGYIAPKLETARILSHGISYTFLMLAALMAIPFAVTLLAVKAEDRKGASVVALRVPTARELIRMPMFWFFGMSLFMTAHAMIAIQQNLISYLRGEGVAPGRAAQALAVALGAAALGKLISGTLADKVSARAGMVFSIVCVILGILTLLNTPPESDLIDGVALIFGMGYGGIFNASPTIVFEYFGTHRVGKTLGLFYIFFGVGTASGGVLAGHIFDITHRWSTAFSLDLGIAAAALIVLLASGRLTRRALIPAARQVSV